MSIDIHPNNTRAPAASAGHHAPRSRDLLRLVFTLAVITGFVLLPFGHSVIAGKGGTVKLGPSRPLAPQQTAAPSAATEPTSQPAPDNVVVTPTPRQSQQLPIELNASAAGGVYRNPYRVLQHSARPCRGGAHTRGSWVHDQSLKPLYPSVGEILGSCQRGHEAVHGRGSVRPELLYKWVPDTCDLVEWSEAGFCKALRGRDIMFAGDSLNDHWHAALIYRLGLHNKDIYKREGTVAGKQSCRSHPICGRYYAKPLRVYFLTNQLLREISKRHVNHKWWKFINQYQVLVLNAGSWMRDPHDETREVDDDEWRGHMDFALKLVQRQRFNGTIIWRTTYQGHPYCWNYKEPLTEELTEEDFPTVPPYKRYRWGAIPGRNNYTTSLWQRAGAHILDITRPTNLMPMGHLGQNHPKFKLRNTTDCLHYCAPGPYDLWSQLLMNLLMGNIDT